jgi:hypothetical protein
LQSGQELVRGDAIDGRVRQCDPDLPVAELRPLHTVEGDHRQWPALRRALYLGLPGQAGEDDEIRVFGALRAR